MAGRILSEKRSIPSPGGTMTLRIARPANAVDKLPGVLWIHGGGYIIGMSSMLYFSRAIDLVRQGKAVAVSPEYRLAHTAPYPAAAEDCYAALKYMKEHAEELGIRDDQLFVGGESAGGGLAVAVSLMARDRREVNIAFLMPLYPMLDCEDTDSSRDNHGRVWNTRRNHYAWKRYLRDIDGPVPSYASPAREKKYRKLPPTYTFVCEGEPFYEETKAYIWKLRRADVKAEMDIFPGNVHAFDMLMPWKEDSIQAKHNFQRQFDNAVRNYRAPQPGKEDPEVRGRIKRK